MTKLENINLNVKRKQKLRLFGGMSFCFVGVAGIYMLYEYYSHSTITKYQAFLHKCYPEEYTALTQRIIEDVEDKL